MIFTRPGKRVSFNLSLRLYPAFTIWSQENTVPVNFLELPFPALFHIFAFIQPVVIALPDTVLHREGQ